MKNEDSAVEGHNQGGCHFRCRSGPFPNWRYPVALVAVFGLGAKQEGASVLVRNDSCQNCHLLPFWIGDVLSQFPLHSRAHNSSVSQNSPRRVIYLVTIFHSYRVEISIISPCRHERGRDQSPIVSSRDDHAADWTDLFKDTEDEDTPAPKKTTRAPRKAPERPKKNVKAKESEAGKKKANFTEAKNQVQKQGDGLLAFIEQELSSDL